MFRDAALRYGFVKRVLAFAALTSLCACGTTLDLGANDAGVPYDADCRPGTYAGTYACNGTDGSLLQSPAQGPITVTLVPVGPHTLALPDASSLVIETSGTAAPSILGAGTMATSTLTGTLDCSTRRLSGGFGPILFASTAFSSTVFGTGPFSATYDPDASPPALIDGVMDSPPALAGTCTWSAQLQ